jgi:protein-S-isoprenylcysteine O-methyltransferase Ste14
MLRIAVHAAVVMLPAVALAGPTVVTRPRALACIAGMLLFGESESAACSGADACRAGAPGTRLALVSALALLAAGWVAIAVPSAIAVWSPVWLGSLLVLAGIALRAVAMRTLGPAFTSEIVAAPGRALVTRGIYAWFRHPSEVGLFLVALGIASLGASAAALGIVVTVLAPSILIRVAREDRVLGR